MIDNSQKTSKYLLSLAIITASCFIYSLRVLPAKAQEQIEATVATTTEAQAPEEPAAANLYYSITIDRPTIVKGYTVSAFNDYLKLSLTPGTLDEATAVEVAQLNEAIDLPWQLNKLSGVYQFEFLNKQAYDNHHPFYIQFAYDSASDNYKQVFFYDKNFKSWRPLPTRDYPEEKFVRSLIHLPFARIAVFEHQETLSIGRASWYKYKNGNYAASPDFPKGSRLRVYLDDPQVTSKRAEFVEVEVNDYGPDRSLHPDRVIDLDKVAFGKLAPLSYGTIKVRVEPVYLPTVSDRVLGIKESGATIKPEIKVKAAVVMNEASGEIVWSKNATTSLPIASLSKLVALKVFLDTRPSLNQEVVYSLADEEYNYQYVAKWESARLRLKEGEKISIENLLYSSLVGSANNSVETLLRVSGLSRADFIAKMNEAVKSWGADSTFFVEPTGLSPANVSSALDYAIISSKALAHPIIAKASATASYKFSTPLSGSHTLRNTNQLIGSGIFKISGGKTGFLDEAGYCLMTRIEAPSNNRLIVVTLGAASRDDSFEQTELLGRYGLLKLEGKIN